MEKNHPKKENTILDSLSPKSNKSMIAYRETVDDLLYNLEGR